MSEQPHNIFEEAPEIDWSANFQRFIDKVDAEMNSIEKIPGFDAASDDRYQGLASTREMLEEMMKRYTGSDTNIADVEADIKSMIEQEGQRDESDETRIYNLQQVLRLIDARELM